jgi:hypothetical protein
MAEQYFSQNILAVVSSQTGQIAVFVLFLFAVFVLFPLYVILRKHKSLIRAQETIDRINWSGEDWTPTEDQINAYRHEGKICKTLNALEAGLLLDFSISRIIALIAVKLEHQGYIQIDDSNSFLFKPLKKRDGISIPYETMFLDTLDNSGAISKQDLFTLADSIIEGVEQKIWDDDIEATQNFYRAKIEELGKVYEDDEKSFYWCYYNSYLSDTPCRGAVHVKIRKTQDYLQKIIPEFTDTYHLYKESKHYVSAFGKDSWQYICCEDEEIKSTEKKHVLTAATR